MAYQVIARKYRPQRFEHVVGQDHVTRTLSHAIEKNRIAHAYLFCGPRGTGKTTLARIFAKCLNCTDGPRTDFPDSDERCLEIAEGRSLDVLEIDGASNRGIEEIRELRDTVRYAPATAKFKIYIIDEVHMLTKEAFNALLKTLEEPPEHAKFMFATTEPEKVLPTILSRCQRFDLRRIPTALIAKHLAEIATKEGVAVDENALQAIARGADGGMRDAESTLDQLISFCGEKIVEADVLSMFGMASRDQVLSLAQAMVAGETLSVLQLVETLTSEGKELGRLLVDLLGFFRSLMLYQLAQENAELVAVSESELAVIRKLSGKLTPDRLTGLLDELSDCDYRLKGASAKRIFFEVSLVKAMNSLQAVPLNEVLKTLNDLKSDSGSVSEDTSGRANAPKPRPAARDDAPSTSVPPPPPPAAPAPAPAPKPVVSKPESAPPATSPASPPPQPVRAVTPASRESAESSEPTTSASPATDASLDLAAVWSKALAFIESRSRFTHSYLKVGRPMRLEGRLMVVGIPPQAEGNIALLEGGKNPAMLSEALSEAGLSGSQLRFVVAPELEAAFEEQQAAKAAEVQQPAQSGAGSRTQSPEATESGAPLAVDLADFRNDPLITEALDIFKGQIVQTGKSS